MGGTSGIACDGSRQLQIHVRVGLLAFLFAFVLALAISPLAAADTGPEAGSGTTLVAPDTGDGPTAAPAPEQSSTEAAIDSTHSFQAGAGAPGEDGTSSGPMAAAEPSGSASGPSAEGTGQAGNPPEQAAATEGPPGQAGNPPGQEAAPQAAAPQAQADQGVVIDQQVDAGASAVQDEVGNAHEQVQVGQPGDTPGLTQENRADAGATATGAVDATTGVEPVVQQDTTAAASAGQTDVGNTHVSVRVDSPGDAGPVTQLNEAAGAATAASVGDTADPESATATAAATQEDVSNTNVSVRVFSPGDDGGVTQQNTAAAHAEAGQAPNGATATAHQDGTRNTHVSVRVGSPGTDGTVSQGNSALATTGDPAGAVPDAEAAAAAVAVTEDALDTAVTVNVPGTGLETPEVWEWNWVWENDESTGAGGAVPGDTSSWNWAWGDDGAPAQGSITRRTATDAELAGTWTWNWDWARAGADWNWSWDWARKLDCGSCVWVWNWDWRWTGAPAAATAPTAATAPAAAPRSPGVSQVNTSTATATVSAAITVTQDVAQDGTGAAEQYVGQLVTVLQDAEAVSLAHQADAVSYWTSGGPVDQENGVLADAAVEVVIQVDQSGTQQVASAGGSDPEQWAGQEAAVTQTGTAQASGLQHDVALAGGGSHHVVGDAAATGRIAIGQDAAQAGAVDGGSLEQWIGQLALVEQALDAVATVTQTGTARSRVTGGFAGATASADGLALVRQDVVQAAVRTIGVGSQTAGQVVAVLQDADAFAGTTQQAGAVSRPLASSEAVAGNRVIVVQSGSQDLLGASDFDVQGLWQESIVVQIATATSISAGGIAGTATATNCAVTQQSAGQGIGMGGQASATADLTTFCWPPPAPAAAPTAATMGTAATFAGPDPVASAPPVDDEVQLFRGGRPFAAPVARAAQVAAGAPGPAAPFAPPVWQPRLGAPTAQVSVLPSTQARFDTRPGSHAGTGDAGTEPPLLPAGGPPAWVSALAAVAAAAGGSSGIAAILLALLLAPPLVQRARDRSVVRRPTLLTSWVDVPV